MVEQGFCHPPVEDVDPQIRLGNRAWGTACPTVYVTVRRALSSLIRFNTILMSSSLDLVSPMSARWRQLMETTTSIATKVIGKYICVPRFEILLLLSETNKKLYREFGFTLVFLKKKSVSIRVVGYDALLLYL